MTITPAQSRAARGMLDWSQTDLGHRANLSESTIRDFEKGRRVPSVNNLAAVERAFEAEGIVFTNGGQPGVILTRPYVAGDYVRAVQVDAHPSIIVRRDSTKNVVVRTEVKLAAPATDIVEHMDAEIAKDRSKRKR